MLRNYSVRTDLALEERERFPGQDKEVSGVSLREQLCSAHVEHHARDERQKPVEHARRRLGSILFSRDFQAGAFDRDGHAQFARDRVDVFVVRTDQLLQMFEAPRFERYFCLFRKNFLRIFFLSFPR